MKVITIQLYEIIRWIITASSCSCQQLLPHTVVHPIQYEGLSILSDSITNKGSYSHHRDDPVPIS